MNFVFVYFNYFLNVFLKNLDSFVYWKSHLILFFNYLLVLVSFCAF